jgi:transketolase
MLVLDADLASSTKAQLFAEAHPERFLRMGIAEQNMVGVAAGLATTGFVPWVSLFGVFFSNRALEPIRMLVAQTDGNVKIAAGYAGVCFGMAGKTHHDHAGIATIRAMPGMTMIAPGDAAEAAESTRWAHHHDGPVYLRLARDPLPALPGEGFALGRLRVLRHGDAECWSRRARSRAEPSPPPRRSPRRASSSRSCTRRRSSRSTNGRWSNCAAAPSSW